MRDLKLKVINAAGAGVRGGEWGEVAPRAEVLPGAEEEEYPLH
jgi:hypothetical protein